MFSKIHWIIFKVFCLAFLCQQLRLLWIVAPDLPAWFHTIFDNDTHSSFPHQHNTRSKRQWFSCRFQDVVRRHIAMVYKRQAPRSWLWPGVAAAPAVFGIIALLVMGVWKPRDTLLGCELEAKSPSWREIISPVWKERIIFRFLCFFMGILNETYHEVCEIVHETTTIRSGFHKCVRKSI